MARATSWKLCERGKVDATTSASFRQIALTDPVHLNNQVVTMPRELSVFIPFFFIPFFSPPSPLLCPDSRVLTSSSHPSKKNQQTVTISAGQAGNASRSLSFPSTSICPTASLSILPQLVPSSGLNSVTSMESPETGPFKN